VPAEWVPVITSDIQRQRRQPAQPPLSDAYLEGLPSKRRKIGTNNRELANPDVPTVLPDLMRSAIQTAGAQPLSSLDAVVQSVAADTALHSVFRQQLRDSIRRRLRNDPDYSPDRFPNAHSYFFE